MKSNLSTCSFMNHACEILLKLSLPHLRSQEFSLLLLVWGFMSMIYFALIFVCSMRYGPEWFFAFCFLFFFLLIDIQFFQHLLLK